MANKLSKPEKRKVADLTLRIEGLIEKIRRGDAEAERYLLLLCEKDEVARRIAKRLLKARTKVSRSYAHTEFCVPVPGGWWPLRK